MQPDPIEPLEPARGEIIGGDFEPGAPDSPLRGFLPLGDNTRIAMVVAVPASTALAKRTVVVEETKAWDRRVNQRENLIVALVAAAVLIVGLFASAVYLAHQRDDAQAKLRAQPEIPTCEQLDTEGYDGTASCIDDAGYLVAPGDAAATEAWKRYDGLEAAWQLCDRYDLWDSTSCQDDDGSPMDRPEQPTVPRPGG